MPDMMSKEERSRHMSLVRGENTRFELQFLRVLSAELYPRGYRYRKHHRPTYGTPDIVFVRYRIAIFLDSDFWHGRNYERLGPKMNPFWRAKIERNMERDIEVNRRLRREGWKVLRFGEADIKKRPEVAVRKIMTSLLKRARKTGTFSIGRDRLVREPPSSARLYAKALGHDRRASGY
jgi:DNA mismatch endonuclease, patch repair protein